MQPGDAFIAVSRHPDQRLQHVQDAVKAGAAVVLVPEAIDLQAPIPLVPVADLAAYRSEIAARYYQSPSQDLCCVGITGTNGKTSIAWHRGFKSSAWCCRNYAAPSEVGELDQLQPKIDDTVLWFAELFGRDALKAHACCHGGEFSCLGPGSSQCRDLMWRCFQI